MILTWSPLQDAQQFESKLSQQHITFSKNYYETITVDNVKDQVTTLENGSDSGRTNSILSANTKLTGNNAIITNTKSLPNVINIHLNNDLVVKGTKNETFSCYTRRQRQGLSFKSKL